MKLGAANVGVNAAGNGNQVEVIHTERVDQIGATVGERHTVTVGDGIAQGVFAQYQGSRHPTNGLFVKLGAILAMAAKVERGG